jgi:hypothetical protein
MGVVRLMDEAGEKKLGFPAGPPRATGKPKLSLSDKEQFHTSQQKPK